ncbi:glycosyltransferase [Segetibacter sp. 3557_3]|uniref:glycosyltransferase family 2 protein n=1 Tax=Segetibacter sp. 3557_3 TaxID=2547429 RepID=UPI001058BB40|nr:glycosyltransferase family 2 protein [Segetibacter sp. 3557_3]TDH20840.1 glycosyltransferase [Segetibacter sp. 3557_3]
MLITVITATYNSAHCVANAIQSVIDQDVFEVEHIIIDGGSSDGTIDIVKRYSAVKWVSEPDRGVYDALNKGLKIAKGKWIYFLGSDDELTEGCLKRLQPDFESTTAQVIYGSVRIKASGKLYDGRFSMQKFLTTNVCQQAIFYRDALFRTSQFDLRFPIAADYAFNINLLSNKSIEIRYVPLPIAIFDDNGLSGRVVDTRFLSKKVSLFSKALQKSRFNAFFDSHRHQEAINQILYGSLLLGWTEMLLWSYRKQVLAKSIYNMLAFTKQRFLQR